MPHHQVGAEQETHRADEERSDHGNDVVKVTDFVRDTVHRETHIGCVHHRTQGPELTKVRLTALESDQVADFTADGQHQLGVEATPEQCNSTL